MASIRNVMVLLLGATLWMSSAQARDQDMLEGIHTLTRKALAERYLYEHRKTSPYGDSKKRHALEEAYNLLRQQNEFEPLAPNERARIESLITGSQEHAFLRSNLLYASL